MLRTAATLLLAALIVAAALIPAQAGFISGDLRISGVNGMFPDVAYNSAADNYLVVWGDYSVGGVSGQLISFDGSIIGPRTALSDGTAYALMPSVAYNATDNEYMVVWIDGHNGGDLVYGRRISATGTPIGSIFQISNTTKSLCAVAWSSVSNCYFVTYYGPVKGRRVSIVGGTPVLGAELDIAHTPGSYTGYPDVCYGATGNQFLVSWEQEDTENVGRIVAQRVSASSDTLIGGPINLTADGGRNRACIAYDSVDSRWMVQFNDVSHPGNSYDQSGQLADTNGSLVGSNFPIAASPDMEGSTLRHSAVSFAPSAQRFISGFHRDINFVGQETGLDGALIGDPIYVTSNTPGTEAMGGDNAVDFERNRCLFAWYSLEGSVYYTHVRLYELNPDPPPGPVKNFVAYSRSAQNNLTWTNPAQSNYTGVMIRYKTTGYPTSTSDGSLVADVAQPLVGVTHAGLTNGVTYYYTAFAHDGTGPHYSVPSYTSATPTAAICFEDTFSYANGALNGNGGWTGSAGSNIAILSGTVNIIGGSTVENATHTTTCGDAGSGYIALTAKVQAGVGTEYMWDLWIDDPLSLNLARWYGSGTTARGRIGGTTTVTATQTLTGGWDELKVKINPYANTTEFFFNGVSIGVLDHGQTGAGDVIGRLRFTRGTTSAVDGNYLFFDSLLIGDDITPPSPVTNFQAVGGLGQNALSWTNPTTSDFAGTIIRYKTSGYPSSATDGTLVCDRSTAPGANDSVNHTGLGGSTYYYAAFAHDSVPNYAPAALASAIPGCVAVWLNHNFDSYTNGNLGGQGGWTMTGAADAQVQSTVAKSGKAVLADTIASGGAAIASQISFDPRSGGYHYVTFDVSQDAAGTTGQEIGYVSFQTSTGSEVARLHVQKSRLMMEYGSGSYAILTTSAANLNWYQIKVGFNVDTRTMDLSLDGVSKSTGSAWKGSGTDLARVVVGSDRNATLSPQKIYVDNLLGETKPGQTAQVRDDGAWTPSLTKLHFDFDPAACAGEYRYAIGTTSGGTNVRNWTTCGQATDVMATGLSLSENQTYYISVQVGTGHETWGASRTSDGIKVAPAIGIQAAKALADGGPADIRALRGKLVSGVFSDCFYLQEPGNCFGIKIASSANVNLGDQMDVCGTVGGSGAERYLDCAGYPAIAATGPGGPHAMTMTAASLGGVALNANTPGVVGGVGLNNIGALVAVCGRVTATGSGFFYIDDGSGVIDPRTNPATGQPYFGVKIISAGPAAPAEFWIATGVSTMESDAGQLIRAIRAVSATRID